MFESFDSEGVATLLDGKKGNFPVIFLVRNMNNISAKEKQNLPLWQLIPYF